MLQGGELVRAVDFGGQAVGVGFGDVGAFGLEFFLVAEFLGGHFFFEAADEFGGRGVELVLGGKDFLLGFLVFGSFEGENPATDGSELGFGVIEGRGVFGGSVVRVGDGDNIVKDLHKVLHEWLIGIGNAEGINRSSGHEHRWLVDLWLSQN